ncbi:MAG: hypothetical protein AAFW46_17745 [Pseudomonadota bacterium]
MNPQNGGELDGGQDPLLEDAAPMTRLFVWSLRCWLDGAAGQQAVWAHYTARLGGRAGARAMRAFEEHVEGLAHQCRRVLRRRRTGCVFVCEDELLMAHTVGAAAAGDLDGAYAAAARYVRASAIPVAVTSAARLGAALALIGDAPSETVPCGDPWRSAPMAGRLH